MENVIQDIINDLKMSSTITSPNKKCMLEEYLLALLPEESEGKIRIAADLAPNITLDDIEIITRSFYYYTVDEVPASCYFSESDARNAASAAWVEEDDHKVELAPCSAHVMFIFHKGSMIEIRVGKV